LDTFNALSTTIGIIFAQNSRTKEIHPISYIFHLLNIAKCNPLNTIYKEFEFGFDVILFSRQVTHGGGFLIKNHNQQSFIGINTTFLKVYI
jgi:hypothetical protein